MNTPNNDYPYQDAIQQLQQDEERWSDWLSHLSPREHKVWCYHYGLEDGQTHTLAETAAWLAVSPERIQQIEHKSLYRSFRHHRSSSLRSFLSDEPSSDNDE